MTSKYSMKKYMKGALILTIAAIVVKILGAVYRVPFQNLVGDKGFYVYQQVYPFVAFFVVWTASGFAVAISKMLAEQSAEANKANIRQTAFLFLTVCALLCFSGLYFGADLLAGLMGDGQLAPVLRTGAFVTLFMPMLALVKGSLQSDGEMKPVAVAQVVEQMVRVGIILAGAILVVLWNGSVYDAGRIAVLGTVIGEFCGFILLLYYIRKVGNLTLWQRSWQFDFQIMKELTIYSITVSMSSLLLICYQLVDSFTFFSILVSLGFDAEQMMVLKGVYDRGQPLVQVGLVIASSLALAIVPVIAYKQSVEKGSEYAFVQLTYRVTLIFGVAAAVGLILVMPYVNVMLFETNDLPVTLSIYVLQIISFSLILTMTAILQGYGKLWVPICILATSILLKFIGNFVLIPLFAAFGAALAGVISSFVAAIGLIVSIRRLVKKPLANKRFYKKLLRATFNMVFILVVFRFGLTVFVHEELSRTVSTIAGTFFVVVGAVLFILSVAKYEVLHVRDWFLIPFGRKFAALQLWLHRK